MTDQAHDVEAIFLAALERTTPTERRAYIDGASGSDADLRSRVMELLQAHEASDGPLDAPPSDLVSPTIACPLTEQPGTQIGPYKLLQQLGEGGMGIVYMAEQTRPVKRRIALKVIKPGMDTRQVIARFEAERQALAMMDHPNIAKVLDAGTTESGRPYFVMELVNGIPITRYSDEQHLSPQERLKLFIPICQAIQHAHQKGVIHRDLKPSNVLIALYDGEPVPKVIDFGVAKATSQNLTDKTLFTQLGQIVGTLEYMSPEQAQRNQLDIDTRSDVYSLGVLLYELLTGSTPLTKERIRSVAYDEMLRLIREEEPEKPSNRLSHSGELLPHISARRRAEPKRLNALLRGDLDRIVMKSLEKDRNLRYDTAIGFAADIQRFLNNEPVEARAPSTAYHVKKFITRNRLSLIAAGTILVLVQCGLVGMSILAHELSTTNRRLVNLLQDYRDQQIEAALLLAFNGQMEKTMAMAEHLETVLTELDPTYQRGATSSLLKGVVHFYRGEERQAREQLDLAVRLDPDAIAPNSIRAVAAVYHGDWGAYLENVPKLEQLRPRLPHDEVFRWYGKLYVDPPIAADALLKLVPDDSESVFGQALTAAALAHAAVDCNDRALVDMALVRAEKAETLAVDSPWVLVASLYAHDAAVQLAKSEGDDIEELLRKAQARADQLAAFEDYLIGRYEVALFLERTNQSEKARVHWLACGMVRDACAVLERDGDIDEALAYLDAQEYSRYNRLTELTLQIGRQPNREILAKYRKLTREEPDLAFGTDALEVPLRLGMADVACDDAKRLLRRSKEKDYEQLGVWIVPPLAYIAGEPAGAQLEAAARNPDSRYRQLYARYWIGLKRLAEGDRDRAIQMFQGCLATGAFDYSNYGCAEALLKRLEDASWPPRE